MPNEIYCMHCMNKVPEGASVCPWCQKDPLDYHAELHHLSPNTILYGKYLIGKVLGEGGFGITYIARDLNLDIRVAVKEYYPYGCVNRNHSYSEDITVSGNVSNQEFESGKRKLMGEARTLAIFSDLKGIVGVRDFFLFNNTAYIVMDYLEGVTLKEYLKTKTTIPFDEAVALLMPIMEDLVKVHETGLVHRDISPDNIMILKNGTARLMDFGAARQTEGTDTKSLSIVLKPGYTPEEQYRSRGEQGPWTDVYALCATIYKAVTGTLPDEALQRLVEDTVKAPSELGVNIPKEKEQALMKGLAVFRKDRYQDMVELINGFKNGEKSDQRVTTKTVCSTLPDRTVIGKDNKKKKVAGIAVAIVAFFVLTFAIGYAQTQSAKNNNLAENDLDANKNPLEDVSSVMQGKGEEIEKEEFSELDEGNEGIADADQAAITGTNDIPDDQTKTELFTFVDSSGSEHTVELNPNVTRNDYRADSFILSGDKMTYTDTEQYAYRLGVDVSYHQGAVDWGKVKAAGYDFAFIRLGYRGYSAAGGLNIDSEFSNNINNALTAGMDVGVYFFTQAVDEAEAEEEADFVVQVLKDEVYVDYDYSQIPVVYVAEKIPGVETRSDAVTGEQYTKNTKAFCEKVKEAGYQPVFYADMLWEIYQFDLEELSEYSIWYADYRLKPQTPYLFTFWQYTNAAKVDGISTAVDANIHLIKSGE